MPDLKMPDLNRYECAGNLTRDPELTTLRDGTALCKFGVAVSRKYKTMSVAQKEDVLFVNVTAWRGTAEWVSENLTKGSPVLIEGRLTMSEWEDKNTGQKRTAIELSAERVQSLAWAESSSKHGEGGNYGNQSAPVSRPKARAVAEPESDDDSLPF